MKHTHKLLALLVCAAMLCAVMPAAALAAGEISVTVDGRPVTFDVPPTAVNGRTLVPVRAIFEALGALVEWDNATQTVYFKKNNVSGEMRIGSVDVTVIDHEGSHTVTLDVPAQIIDGRTFVPARAAAEILHATVNWLGDENRVEILTNEVLTNTRNVYLSSANSDIMSHKSNGDPIFVDYKSYSAVTSVFINNGIIYYSFAERPAIFAFDGGTTRSYNTGGEPSNIVVSGNYLYYLNEDNQSVNQLDLTTGSRKPLYSGDGAIRKFLYYNGKIYIIEGLADNRFYAKDEKNIEFPVYEFDIATGESRYMNKLKMYNSKLSCPYGDHDYMAEISNFDMATICDGATVKNGKLYITAAYEAWYKCLKTDEECVHGNLMFAIDLNDFTVETVYNRIMGATYGADTPWVPETGEKDFSIFSSGNNIYMRELGNNSIFSSSGEYYLEFDPVTNKAVEIDEDEYYSHCDDTNYTRINNSEWFYDVTNSNADRGSLMRINKKSGIEEILVKSEGKNANKISYRYITDDPNCVVFCSGFSSFRYYRDHQWDTPSDYSKAKIYIMDPDGNNIIEIASNESGSSSGNTSGSSSSGKSSGGSSSGSGSSSGGSSGGTGVLATCPICGGSGRHTCYYCHGSGLRDSVTLSPCPRCGGAGSEMCTNCMGSGKIIPK